MLTVTGVQNGVLFFTKNSWSTCILSLSKTLCPLFTWAQSALIGSLVHSAVILHLSAVGCHIANNSAFILMSFFWLGFASALGLSLWQNQTVSGEPGEVVGTVSIFLVTAFSSCLETWNVQVRSTDGNEDVIFEVHCEKTHENKLPLFRATVSQISKV